MARVHTRECHECKKTRFRATYDQRVETTKREMFSQKTVRLFVGDSSAFVSDSSWAPSC